MNSIMAVERPFCAPVDVDSEDPLFILYTSGSTGKVSFINPNCKNQRSSPHLLCVGCSAVVVLFFQLPIPAPSPLSPLLTSPPLSTSSLSGMLIQPKGIVHSTAGYLVSAMLTQRVVFDCHEGDVFASTADIG